MQTRRFGRLGWPVSELGYGMWGMSSWSGSDDEGSREALHEAVRLGCTFFDTAWGYGRGHSEQLLGELVRAYPEHRLHTATKIPPKNMQWPSRRGMSLDEVFPPEHIREYAGRSLDNLGVETIDLLQFHVWEDAWAHDDRWWQAMADLRAEGCIRGVGISVNRWEPRNVLETLRTGHVDAVQVIYNIFDQAPADELLPLCSALDIAVIARVPFDEGSLAGALHAGSAFPEGDFRRIYFGPENLGPTLNRVAALREDLPSGTSLPETALRFVVSDPRISTVIPGMRRVSHVRANAEAVEAGPLDAPALARLRSHRWDRQPTEWSL